MVVSPNLANKIRKPRTQRGKRILKRREPKIFEDGRNSLFMSGTNCIEPVREIIRDLCALRKPDALYLKSAKPFHVLEDETEIERFCKKTECSNFVVGTHSKKRPCNIVFGRLFDSHILDSVEFRVLYYKLSNEFSKASVPLGTKPCIILNGGEFKTDPNMARIANILIDFFKGQEVKKIRLAGLEHLISITLISNVMYLRSYRVLLKKSATRLPRVELEEVGPSLDLKVDRFKFASDSLWKQATKVPVQAKPKKVKNISKDVFGSKIGRIHMQRQELDKFTAGKRVKALRTRDPNAAAKRSKVDGVNEDDNQMSDVELEED